MSVKALLTAVAVALAGCVAVPMEPDTRPWRVVGESTVGGFAFPESVGCDRGEGVLYVSQFGGTELKPAEKDGLGFISKVALDGRILEAKAFPDTMNKPKGIWVDRGRLWVTDIDGVWIFDTRSKKGRKLMIPGIQFANDPAVVGNVLYVSDNRSDTLFRVEPADFIDPAVNPAISAAWSNKDVNPNGLWPARDGSLLVVGFLAPDKPRGIYTMARDGNLTALSQPLGRLDGVYELRDGTGLLVTDWNTGTLSKWSPAGGWRLWPRTSRDRRISACSARPCTSRIS
jgi:sugar lactone lactonase YvrE